MGVVRRSEFGGEYEDRSGVDPAATYRCLDCGGESAGRETRPVTHELRGRRVCDGRKCPRCRGRVRKVELGDSPGASTPSVE